KDAESNEDTIEVQRSFDSGHFYRRSRVRAGAVRPEAHHAANARGDGTSGRRSCATRADSRAIDETRREIHNYNDVFGARDLVAGIDRNGNAEAHPRRTFSRGGKFRRVVRPTVGGAAAIRIQQRLEAIRSDLDLQRLHGLSCAGWFERR